jgi:hypothetical protein
MKKVLFFACLLASFHLFAQKDVKKWDIRLGIGVSLLGTGDIPTITVEHEANYQLNRFFTAATSIMYGYSTYNEYKVSLYGQGNLNLFFSPFNNHRKNDFRIGTGLSFYGLKEIYPNYFAYAEAIYYKNHPLPDKLYSYKRNSFGYNLIIENTYTIKKKILIGAKAFVQPYNNGDMNAGILLKLGVKI